MPYKTITIEKEQLKSSSFIKPRSGSYKFSPFDSGEASLAPVGYQLSDLTAFTEYEIVVAAVNSQGPGPETTPTTVTTREDGEFPKSTFNDLFLQVTLFKK